MVNIGPSRFWGGLFCGFPGPRTQLSNINYPSLYLWLLTIIHIWLFYTWNIDFSALFMNRKFFQILIGAIITSLNLFAQADTETLLKELSQTIDQSAQYDSLKLERIGQIKSTFINSGLNSPVAQYDFFLDLYEEYKIFGFDSAFAYAKKMEELALSSGKPGRIAQARTRLAFVLLSAGMYGESDDVLKQVSIAGQPDSLKADYYLLRGRYYYDLADYTNDNFFYPTYLSKAGDYFDSAVSCLDPKSFESIYYSGLKQMKTGNLDDAFVHLQSLLGKTGLTEHQVALTASTLSFIYLSRGDVNQAISHQAIAAIADIKSSTKETFAILNLSQLLFQQGDFARASQFIKKAIDDATTYGARQRTVQVNSIMPIIQGSEINYIKKQRTSLIIYGTVVSLALLLFAFLLVVIYRQNKKLEAARAEISDAHEKLRRVNDRLQQLNAELHVANTNLLDANARLEESNKIKEEYVGHFFTTDADFFQKVEKFKLQIEEKIHYGKFNEVKYIVNTLNIKQEKEELVKRFDKVFLKLFPRFVDEFNALFDEENQVKLQEGEYLNTDLRIYALLRLGIKENEKIAEILEYSVKSIYAYKTKIRNKANVPKDEFDRRVMEISSI